MLTLLGCVGLAALLGFTSVAPTPAAPAMPYQDTAVGVELCLNFGAAGNSVDVLVAAACQIDRVQYGLGQGATLRAKAISQGSVCEQYAVTGTNVLRAGPGIWICFGYSSPLVQRGGTTYGDTFFYSGSKSSFDRSATQQAVINHEAEHTVQWYLFGSRYPQLYFEAGPNACANVFEITAGLAAGGYSC